MMQTVRFGHAEYRPAERRLLIEGADAGIGSRAFDVLGYLIAHRDRAVSKEELLAVVWPNTVVEENNLQVQISALRKLLGPRIVVTIPGFGYQFTAAPESDAEPVSNGSDHGAMNGSAATPASADSGSAAPRPPLAANAPPRALQGTRAIWLAAAGLLALLVLFGLLSLTGVWRSPAPAPEAAETGAPLAPAHSIAVLPFVNMSGDPDQEYFSDGITDELLNSLSTVGELQVAARTSSFSFKGEPKDITQIARKLNVRTILEGSVRREGARVRISVTLISAATGYQLWSQTYDKDLRNILALQKDVASEVTRVLKAKLLNEDLDIGGLGGTSNPQAFDAYLRGEAGEGQAPSRPNALAQVAAYDQALRLDPNFAQAYIGKARALAYMGGQGLGNSAEVREAFRQSRAAAEKAVQLAPNLGRAHAALAMVLTSGFFDFSRALAEYDRALALAPGDAQVLRESAFVFAQMGRTDLAIAQARHAVALDPLNSSSHVSAGDTYGFARRYQDALDSYDRALLLDPKMEGASGTRGMALYLTGRFEEARQSCLMPPTNFMNRVCLSVAYEKLGRHADAIGQLAALQHDMGDAAAYQYAQVYAQWGDRPKALDALELAYRLHDAGLDSLRADPFLDPLRSEPRFRQIEAALHFPSG
jgi:TolB-like protein/DNA-binding winged helix-turn-helix (wHTH) protein/lipoprotein NlpI